MSERLRRLEQDFKKNLLRNPVQSPFSPVVIGPQGAQFNFQLGISIPFRQMLEGHNPDGSRAIPDQVLELLLREVEAEMKKRGLKP